MDYLPKILSFQVHPPNEFSHHCKIETKLSCRPQQTPKTTDGSLSNSQFNKYIWEGDISKKKIIEAVSSPTFNNKKQQILTKNYNTTPGSVEEAVEDVEELLTVLHMSSCKVKRVNKIKRKRNRRIHQPWYTEQCECMRKRIRRAGDAASKDPYNRQKQTELSTAKRDYNRLIRKVKREHRVEVITKLETLNSENNNDFWPLLKKLRSTKKDITSVEMTELLKHF